MICKVKSMKNEAQGMHAFLLSHPEAFAVGDAEHFSAVGAKIDVSFAQCAGQSTEMNNL